MAARKTPSKQPEPKIDYGTRKEQFRDGRKVVSVRPGTTKVKRGDFATQEAQEKGIRPEAPEGMPNRGQALTPDQIIAQIENSPGKVRVDARDDAAE
jgi:hypothetical protein